MLGVVRMSTFAEQRTESKERGETVENGDPGLPATFAQDPKAAPVLALRAGKKRPEQSLV